MAFRLYIVPQVGTGTRTDVFRPKYFMSALDGTGTIGVLTTLVDFGTVDFGFEGWFVVGGDLSTSDDNLIVGQSDAFALPFDLSPTLTAGQVTNVQTKLEAIGVPAQWVTTSLTWLQVVRIVLHMLSLIQHFAAVHNVAGFTFLQGANLSAALNTLPASVRQDLLTSATDLGLSTTGITGSTTIRAALKALADQMQTRQYNFAGTLI